jgi:hypothetical protein
MNKFGLVSALASLLGGAGEEVVRAKHSRRRYIEGKKGTSNKSKFNTPSTGKLKRAGGRMTKGRREIQKQLATGLEVAPSEGNIILRNF